MVENYELIAESPEVTVVATYPTQTHQVEGSQTEAQMEALFVKQLQEQGYEYLPITKEDQLLLNLRQQIEKLNDITFTDGEWKRFYTAFISNPNMGIIEKTHTIQNDAVKTFTFDDGTIRNISLIDKKNIHRNHLQVINQFEEEQGAHKTRYDVTILVNGLPLVHCELKKRGVNIREAFNQIKRYNRDSFWAGCGLYEYAQIFIISNGTRTKYYSNTTRAKHIKEVNRQHQTRGKVTSHSYEFTNYWASADNKRIMDIEDFTATFFCKHTILNILTRYCILDIDNNLLVMRPYQIAATEAIMQRIKVSSNHKDWFGTTQTGGYIWHTTGSGKTLTSFKTARQCCELKDVDKVLFVVDRKDLDHQTMLEYDRFEKGAANSTKNTNALKKQLEKPNGKIVITTIQKLSVFIKQNPTHEVYGKHVVMIFDECHRSQFGDMHREIIKKFKRYHIFGFTGTPIFPQNSQGGKYADMLTTGQTFGDRLHTYTINDAIRDENVLPFRIDYIKTMESRQDMTDEQVYEIAGEHAILGEERISEIVGYVLEHYSDKTKRNYRYTLKQQPVCGFNSIFACESIKAAKLYYAEFQRQMAALPAEKRLKIALIYSYAANANDPDETGMLGEENSEDTNELSVDDRTFLDAAIMQYNEMFGCNYSTDGDHFQDYYKNVSQRMKNRELDMLIVVNMFLTGFDATTLNTLWVDKNLRMHGLLQAYSRTNRILNSIKTFGNIVCFRALEKATNEAIALFGDAQANGIVLLRPYEDYINGYTDDGGKFHEGYLQMVTDLLTQFPINHIVESFTDEVTEKEFIKLFGSIRRAINILQCFDSFSELPVTLDVGLLNNYTSVYLDLKEKYRPDDKGEETDVNDDISFEIELIKQVEVSIAYILHLVAEMRGMNQQNSEIQLTKIRNLMGASPDLRDKRELIERFIARYTPCDDVEDTWNEYICSEQKRELEQIATEESVDVDKAYTFMRNAFRDGRVPEEGTAVTDILPASARSFFSGNRASTKKRILEKMKEYFNKYYNISGGIYPRGERLEEQPAIPMHTPTADHQPSASYTSFTELLKKAGVPKMENLATSTRKPGVYNPKPSWRCPALSCHQPWATLLCAGIKDIENRKWSTDYRGRLFIVASTGNDVGVLRHNLLPQPCMQVINEHMQKGELPAFNEYPQSAVIGYVEIKNCTQERVSSPWGNSDVFNWEVGDAYIFDEPQCVGIKGQFHIFDIPELDPDNLPPAHKVEQ